MPWSGRQKRSADERECRGNANLGLTGLSGSRQPIRQHSELLRSNRQSGIQAVAVQHAIDAVPCAR